MKREKLSVNVITYNEAAKLDAALASVSWADEIIVIDSHSPDHTIEVARKYTDKIYQEPFCGYGALRNLAIERSAHPWILSLDTDERVTPELREEIEQEFQSPRADAYRIPRRSHFLGRWIRHGGWYPDYRSMQLFRKERGRYTDRLAHDHLELIGPARVASLRNHIDHFTHDSLDEYLYKTTRYAELMAQEMKKQGRRFFPTQLVSRPLAMFLKMYLIKQGFRDGRLGLILAGLYAYYTFLKYAIFWDLSRNPSRPSSPAAPQ